MEAGETVLKKKITLTNRIFLISLLIAAFSSITLSTASFILFNGLLTEKMNEQNRDLKEYLVQEFRKSLTSIEAFSDYVFLHRDINAILTSETTDEKELFYIKREADEDIDNYLTTRAGFKIQSLSILGRDKQQYLYGYDVNATDFSNFREKKWAESRLILNDQLLWLGLYNRDDLFGRSNDYVISLLRFIFSPEDNSKIGLMVLELSPLDLFKEWEWLESDNYSIFLFDGNDRIIYPSHTHLGLGWEDMEEEWETEGYLIAEETVTSYGWKIAIVQTTEYRKQLYTRMVLITMLIFVIVMILHMAVFFFMISRITQPLSRLTKTIHNVREGDHTARYYYSSDDEIGYLTSSFNTMLDRIDNLREQSILDERKKNDAEYRALQAQMNPHFLYNTLNTIKWMAIIQGADNIVNSLEILSRLLRANLKKRGSFVSLEEELNMLNDYVELQKIRYKSKFNFSCRIEEETKQLSLLKFMIQPVVENAIFHGIEPKDGVGNIDVTARRAGENLIVTVEDNGVGFDSSDYDPLVEDEKEHKGNRIGLKNIQERIRRAFGDEYGLEYKSSPGLFTKVTITIPAQPYQEEKNSEE